MRFLKKVKTQNIVAGFLDGESKDTEQLVTTLKSLYPEQKQEAIRAVAMDIYYGGDLEIIANNSLVDKLFDKWSKKESTKAAKDAVAADNPDSCPLCKLPTVAIKLDKERPAKWCSRHFVVFPSKGA